MFYARCVLLCAMVMLSGAQATSQKAKNDVLCGIARAWMREAPAPLAAAVAPWAIQLATHPDQHDRRQVQEKRGDNVTRRAVRDDLLCVPRVDSLRGSLRQLSDVITALSLAVDRVTSNRSTPEALGKFAQVAVASVRAAVCAGASAVAKSWNPSQVKHPTSRSKLYHSASVLNPLTAVKLRKVAMTHILYANLLLHTIVETTFPNTRRRALVIKALEAPHARFARDEHPRRHIHGLPASYESAPLFQSQHPVLGKLWGTFRPEWRCEHVVRKCFVFESTLPDPPGAPNVDELNIFLSNRSSPARRLACAHLCVGSEMAPVVGCDDGDWLVFWRPDRLANSSVVWRGGGVETKVSDRGTRFLHVRDMEHLVLSLSQFSSKLTGVNGSHACRKNIVVAALDVMQQDDAVPSGSDPDPLAQALRLRTSFTSKGLRSPYLTVDEALVALSPLCLIEAPEQLPGMVVLTLHYTTDLRLRLITAWTALRMHRLQMLLVGLGYVLAYKTHEDRLWATLTYVHVSQQHLL
jgi:hypothetical protein